MHRVKSAQRLGVNGVRWLKLRMHRLRGLISPYAAPDRSEAQIHAVADGAVRHGADVHWPAGLGVAVAAVCGSSWRGQRAVPELLLP
jgi:hypothetical protein